MIMLLMLLDHILDLYFVYNSFQCSELLLSIKKKESIIILFRLCNKIDWLTFSLCNNNDVNKIATLVFQPLLMVAN